MLGLGLVSFAVFLCELSLMRAVAQVTWPPFAFVALSSAMLGGGVAGTVFALRPSWAQTTRATFAGGVLVTVGAPLSLVVALRIGLEPLLVGQSLSATLTFVLALVAFAVPFAGLGAALSAMLERAQDSVQRIYGADLLGGAAGAFLAVFVLDWFGPVGAGLLAGLCGALGTMLFTARRRWRVALLVVATSYLALCVAGATLMPQATQEKRIGREHATDVLDKLEAQGALTTEDRADGRVDVIPARPAPRVMIDLGAAMTRAPVFPVSGPPPRDQASAAFLVKAPQGPVLIVGSGAGYEVARALSHGAPSVDAVEILSGIAAIVPHPALMGGKRVYEDKRVAFHHMEARAFLERTEKKYSHIVAVHTITNAALASGALRLSEDFLLTAEAMDTFLSHLDDGGVLYFTRPKGQLSLLTALSRDALLRKGVPADEVDRHLVAVLAEPDDAFFSGLLVFARPVDAQALPLPDHTRVIPLPTDYDGPMPTDDRPFFHRFAEDYTQNASTRLRIEGPALVERAVLTVGIIASLAALLVLVLPLFFRRQSRRPGLQPLLAAALLGLGFMFAELSLAQRFSLICARPLLAFGAVVGGMLLGAGGLAVWFSDHRLSARRVLAISAIALSAGTFLPPALTALGALTWGLPARLLLTGATAALVALPLGLPFPALVAQVQRHFGPGSSAWLYAVNAVLAVFASALFAALSPWLGLAGMGVLAAGVYAVAALVAPAD